MAEGGPTNYQVNAIRELAERNNDAIKEMAERREKDHAEIMAGLNRLSGLILGNGEPSRGILYRVERAEEKAHAAEEKTQEQTGDLKQAIKYIVMALGVVGFVEVVTVIALVAHIL